MCNRIFAEGHTSISQVTVQQICQRILEEQEATFFQYRNLLTSVQWQTLKAVAKEDKLYQPNASAFISTYHLATPSNVQRSIEALMAKEMIYKEDEGDGSYYRLYDCFLAKWVEKL